MVLDDLVEDVMSRSKTNLALLLVSVLVFTGECVVCPKTEPNGLACTYLVGSAHDDGAPFCLCANEIPTVEIGANTSILIATWPRLNRTVELNFTIEPLETMWAHHYVSIGPYEGNETLTVLALEAVHTGKSFFRFTNVSEPLFVNWKDVVRSANVVHLLPLNVLAAVIGWIYFACWTVSYYPQPLLNCYRRSVVGLNVDFVILSVIGYIGYLVFNLSLFFSSAIQDQYFLRHPGGINPVRPSDVAFSIHSMIMSSFVLLQVIFLKRGQQKVSRISKVIIVVLFLGIYVCGLLSVGNNVIKWLDFLYIMSYVKLFINIIKDVPQLWQIYRTKTTAGYSMLGVWIDLAGGVFSLLQMFILAYNYDDWTSLFGDPTKFGVGVFSILTDFIVMWQHYVLYGAKEKDGKNAERVMLMRIVRRPCPCVLNLLRCFKRRRFNAKDRGYDSVNEHSRLINDNC